MLYLLHGFISHLADDKCTTRCIIVVWRVKYLHFVVVETRRPRSFHHYVKFGNTHLRISNYLMCLHYQCLEIHWQNTYVLVLCCNFYLLLN